MPADRTTKTAKGKKAAPAAAAVAPDAAEASTSSASTSSKRDVKKPWSRRVQEPPQALPKSLLSQKRKAGAAPPAETQEEAETPILTGLDPSAYHSSSSEGEDSSDDDDDDISDSGAIDAGVDVGKLPTVAKDDATVKRKLEKAKKSKDKAPGTLYLGRIPHGFYEKQMKSYFEQFGTVEKVRLARNKKTGKSKHYGFIQMQQLSVAEIVAETMDNYLLLGHILRCKVLPTDEIHPDMWIGANRKFRAVPAVRLERARLEKLRTEDEREKAERRLAKRNAAKKAKLAALGIDYDLDAAAIKGAPAAQAA